jgi:hypothetical protein
VFDQMILFPISIIHDGLSRRNPSIIQLPCKWISLPLASF